MYETSNDLANKKNDLARSKQGTSCELGLRKAEPDGRSITITITRAEGMVDLVDGAPVSRTGGMTTRGLTLASGLALKRDPGAHTSAFFFILKKNNIWATCGLTLCIG